MMKSQLSLRHWDEHIVLLSLWEGWYILHIHPLKLKQTWVRLDPHLVVLKLDARHDADRVRGPVTELLFSKVEFDNFHIILTKEFSCQFNGNIAVFVFVDNCHTAVAIDWFISRNCKSLGTWVDVQGDMD